MLTISSKIHISDDILKNLDLLQFNKGKNPYPGDTSIFNTFKLGGDFFRRKIRDRIGFTGGQKVLDLLCGHGRWTGFLAEENSEVIGLDHHEEAIHTARNMMTYFGMKNATFIQGDVMMIRQMRDNEFDYVWMYSALQYVRRGLVLAEVNRILKPGGKIFVGNYNSIGLMLEHLVNGLKTSPINQGLPKWALDGLLNGPLGDGCPNYGTLEDCDKLCDRFGLELIRVDYDQAIDLSASDGRVPASNPPLAFEYYPRTIEWVASKKHSLKKQWLHKWLNVRI